MIENLICADCGIRDDGVMYYECLEHYFCSMDGPLCVSCMKAINADEVHNMVED